MTGGDRLPDAPLCEAAGSSVEAAMYLGLRDPLQRLDEGGGAQRHLALAVDVPDALERVRHLAVQLPARAEDQGRSKHR